MLRVCRMFVHTHRHTHNYTHTIPCTKSTTTVHRQPPSHIVHVVPVRQPECNSRARFLLCGVCAVEAKRCSRASAQLCARKSNFAPVIYKILYENAATAATAGGSGSELLVHFFCRMLCHSLLKDADEDAVTRRHRVDASQCWGGRGLKEMYACVRAWVCV